MKPCSRIESRDRDASRQGVSTAVVVLCLVFSVLTPWVEPGAHAAKPGVITVATTGTCPPMEMKGPKGRVVGYEVDLMEAVAKEAGLKVKFVERPWSKLLDELERGRCDAVIAQIAVTDARKQRFDFSEPYLTGRKVLVVRSEGAAEPLEGKSLGVFRLCPKAEALRLYQRCSIAYYTMAETDRAFVDLADGFIAGVLAEAPVASHYVLDDKRFKGRFRVADVPAFGGCQAPEEEYAIAVRKGDTKLLGLLNKGLGRLKEKGVLEKIFARWVKELPVRGGTEGVAGLKQPATQQ